MKRILFLSTLLVFFFSCWIGFSIAQQKPLWNDEIFTEKFTIGPSGYRQIMAGQNPEGTKGAVYGCVQKFINQVFSYKLPEGVTTPGPYADRTAQVVLRISSIVWMSLAVAVLFYYFASTTALWAGAVALLMTASTFMVWAFWAEDRPYSFWFLLMTLESIFILMSCQGLLKRPVAVKAFALVHILLASTAAISLVQILAASVFLFASGYRRKLDHLLMTAIPAAICVFYYSRSIHMPVVFGSAPWQFITANIPLDRLVFVIAGGMYLWWRQKSGADVSYLFYSGVMLLAAIVMLILFKMKEAPGSGYLLHARHFIFLAPVGIIAATYVFVRLFQGWHSRMAKALMIALLAALVIPRIWKYMNFSFVTGGPN